MGNHKFVICETAARTAYRAFYNFRALSLFQLEEDATREASRLAHLNPQSRYRVFEVIELPERAAQGSVEVRQDERIQALAPKAQFYFELRSRQERLLDTRVVGPESTVIEHQRYLDEHWPEKSPTECVCRFYRRTLRLTAAEFQWFAERELELIVEPFEPGE